jgi:hypothetical protein
MGENKRYPGNHGGPDLTQRFCWVLRSSDARGPWPGLIIEWRQLPSLEWSARVEYIPDHRKRKAVSDWFHESWLEVVDAWPSERTRQRARG